jgi:glycosyltransferase involved in cell wall biosynthesis
MKNTNILFITPNAPNGINGGMERVVSVIAHELRERGFQIYTLSFDEPRDILVNHFYVPKNCEKVECLIQILNQFKIELLIVNVNVSYDILAIIRKLKKRVKIAVFIEHHGAIHSNLSIIHGCIYSIIKGAFYKRIIKIVFFIPYIIYAIFLTYYCFYLHYILSNKYILLSDKFIPDLKKKLFFLSIEEKKIAAINNPLSLPFKDINDLCKENIVLFAGRIHAYDKNIFEMLRIWRIIERKSEYSHWKLIILGDGPDKDRMQKKVEKKKLRNIVFLGKQNPEKWYEKAKIFMLTSREGWGLVLTEAMQYKVIPVAYNAFSSVTDIICDGNNGYLVKNNDTKAYADKLMWIMDNYKNLEHIKRNGYEYIKRFSLKITIKKWTNLISTQV